MQNQDEYYVEQNIKEAVHFEIQHFAALKYRLNYTLLDEGTVTKSENGYTFVVSPNGHLLQDFIDSINTVINNEHVLDHFRRTENNRSEIEVKVYIYKKWSLPVIFRSLNNSSVLATSLSVLI
jgi:hypothetical protein